MPATWKLYLAAALAFATLAWYAVNTTISLGEERQGRRVAEQLASDNAEQVTVLQDAWLGREAAVERAQASADKTRRRAETIKQEVDHAEDGPLAPALAIAVDRLRRTAGPAPGGGDRGADPRQSDRPR